ncbi:MAG: MFS transporter [Chloroflexi bacterium]|nr:MFS transporter [Chloroflexota bacterium]
MQSSPAPPPKSSMFDDMKEGLDYVRSNEIILALVLLALVPMVLGAAYQMMMPVFAKDELGIGPEGLGILTSAPGIGAFVGATAIASLNSFRRRGLLLLTAAGLFGLTLAVFSLSHSAVLSVFVLVAPGALETSFLAVSQTFWTAFSVLVLVAVGTAQSSFNAVNQTLVQTYTPDELRGRVVAILYLDVGLGPLGTTLAGALTGVVGAPVTIGLMGVSAHSSPSASPSPSHRLGDCRERASPDLWYTLGGETLSWVDHMGRDTPRR